MAETKAIALTKSEVVRRLKRFREGLQMSRRAFGEVQAIRQRDDVVAIFTDKHTMYIPSDLWRDLGTVGEEAVARHEPDITVRTQA